MTDKPLVVLTIFGTLIEAELAHSALEAAGIDSQVRPDDCGGMQPALQMRGVQLLVREEDVDETLLILQGPAVSG